MRGKRKPGRPKKTWKWQVEKESESVGLEKKDAMNRARSIEGVREIVARASPPPPPPPVYGDKNWIHDDDDESTDVQRQALGVKH